MEQNLSSRFEKLYKRLVSTGFAEDVAKYISSLEKEGMITDDEWDSKALEALKSLPSSAAISLLENLKASNYRNAVNKSAYLFSAIKAQRQRINEKTITNPLIKTKSDKNHINNETPSFYTGMALKRYNLSHSRDSNVGYPEKGSEILLKNIPRCLNEEDVLNMVEKLGKIWELRIITSNAKNSTINGKRLNKDKYSSYVNVYVTFMFKSDAQKALISLNDHIIQGNTIKAAWSDSGEGLRRIQYYNFDHDMTKPKIFEQISAITNGLVDIIFKPTQDICLLEYENHSLAESALQILTNYRSPSNTAQSIYSTKQQSILVDVKNIDDYKYSNATDVHKVRSSSFSHAIPANLKNDFTGLSTDNSLSINTTSQITEFCPHTNNINNKNQILRDQHHNSNHYRYIESPKGKSEDGEKEYLISSTINKITTVPQHQQLPIAKIFVVDWAPVGGHRQSINNNHHHANHHIHSTHHHNHVPLLQIPFSSQNFQNTTLYSGNFCSFNTSSFADVVTNSFPISYFDLSTIPTKHPAPAGNLSNLTSSKDHGTQPQLPLLPTEKDIFSNNEYFEIPFSNFGSSNFSNFYNTLAYYEARPQEIKALHVRNLTDSVNEDEIRIAFSAFGKVERVKKVRTFAFVHFLNPSEALHAMKMLNNTQLCDARIQITVAKKPFNIHNNPTAAVAPLVSYSPTNTSSFSSFYHSNSNDHYRSVNHPHPQNNNLNNLHSSSIFTTSSTILSSFPYSSCGVGLLGGASSNFDYNSSTFPSLVETSYSIAAVTNPASVTSSPHHYGGLTTTNGNNNNSSSHVVRRGHRKASLSPPPPPTPSSLSNNASSRANHYDIGNAVMTDNFVNCYYENNDNNNNNQYTSPIPFTIDNYNPYSDAFTISSTASDYTGKFFASNCAAHSSYPSMSFQGDSKLSHRPYVNKDSSYRTNEYDRKHLTDYKTHYSHNDNSHSTTFTNDLINTTCTKVRQRENIVLNSTNTPFLISKLQPIVDNVKEPLVGLEYITEYHSFSKGLLRVRYECVICELILDAEEKTPQHKMVEHVRGNDHIRAYIVKDHLDIWGALVKLAASTETAGGGYISPINGGNGVDNSDTNNLNNPVTTTLYGAPFKVGGLNISALPSSYVSSDPLSSSATISCTTNITTSSSVVRFMESSFSVSVAALSSNGNGPSLSMSSFFPIISRLIEQACARKSVSVKLDPLYTKQPLRSYSAVVVEAPLLSRNDISPPVQSSMNVIKNEYPAHFNNTRDDVIPPPNEKAAPRSSNYVCDPQSVFTSSTNREIAKIKVNDTLIVHQLLKELKLDPKLVGYLLKTNHYPMTSPSAVAITYAYSSTSSATGFFISNEALAAAGGSVMNECLVNRVVQINRAPRMAASTITTTQYANPATAAFVANHSSSFGDDFQGRHTREFPSTGWDSLDDTYLDSNDKGNTTTILNHEYRSNTLSSQDRAHASISLLRGDPVPVSVVSPNGCELWATNMRGGSTANSGIILPNHHESSVETASNMLLHSGSFSQSSRDGRELYPFSLRNDKCLVSLSSATSPPYAANASVHLPPSSNTTSDRSNHLSPYKEAESMSTAAFELPGTTKKGCSNKMGSEKHSNPFTLPTFDLNLLSGTATGDKLIDNSFESLYSSLVEDRRRNMSNNENKSFNPNQPLSIPCSPFIKHFDSSSVIISTTTYAPQPKASFAYQSAGAGGPGTSFAIDAEQRHQSVSHRGQVPPNHTVFSHHLNESSLAVSTVNRLFGCSSDFMEKTFQNLSIGGDDTRAAAAAFINLHQRPLQPQKPPPPHYHVMTCRSPNSETHYRSGQNFSPILPHVSSSLCSLSYSQPTTAASSHPWFPSSTDTTRPTSWVAPFAPYMNYAVAAAGHSNFFNNGSAAVAATPKKEQLHHPYYHQTEQGSSYLNEDDTMSLPVLTTYLKNLANYNSANSDPVQRVSSYFANVRDNLNNHTFTSFSAILSENGHQYMGHEHDKNKYNNLVHDRQRQLKLARRGDFGSDGAATVSSEGTAATMLFGGCSNNNQINSGRLDNPFNYNAFGFADSFALTNDKFANASCTNTVNSTMNFNNRTGLNNDCGHLNFLR